MELCYYKEKKLHGSRKPSCGDCQRELSKILQKFSLSLQFMKRRSNVIVKNFWISKEFWGVNQTSS